MALEKASESKGEAGAAMGMGVGLMMPAMLANLYSGATTTPSSKGNRCPALEQAAAALAQSQFETANRQFLEIAKDPATPAFVRGLAVTGTAQTALARKDRKAALAIWRQLAADNSLPRWQRDLAEQRAKESARRLKGLPERDPAASRASLPSLPKPAVTFHVATNGSDTAVGSKSRPFASLARARDAIRELKKSNGGSLPKRGVTVMLHGVYYHLTDTLRLTADDSGTVEAPKVLLAAPARNLDRSAPREMTLFAVHRLARTEPEAAAAVLRGKLASQLPAEDVAYLWGRIAYEGACRLMPEAHGWYALADPALLSDEQLAWKARAALRAADWQAGRDAVDRMSALERQDPTWSYWYGRALGAQGRQDGARAYFLRVSGQPHFYGLLAAEELGAMAGVPEPFHLAGGILHLLVWWREDGRVKPRQIKPASGPVTPVI